MKAQSWEWLNVDAVDMIYLVACAVNGVAPEAELVAEMDLDAVYQLARRHMLAATVAPALEAAGTNDERFSKALRHSALKNATMDAEMDVLFAELDAAGIWHMPLKGVVLQHLYPSYGMRQMSDHDILFDAERADDVRAIMEELGFTTEKFAKGCHDVYHKKPVCNFEMHRALFGPASDESVREYYQNVRDRLLGDGYEKRLGPEDFYLYVTAHEHKHYVGGGTGLRSLLDTYVYLRSTELDMGYVATEAQKMGLAGFEEANRTLAQHLFSGRELTEADEEMLGYVMSSGVYGTTLHRVENAMARSGHGRLRYVISRFLVPVSKKDKNYEVMAGVYPFFYEHKWLLPLLPFYRTLRGIKNGKLKAEARAVRDAKR